MDDKERSEIKQQLVGELKADYYIVSKDDWRSYTCRTLASLILLGGVTSIAVLGVVWGGTGAATRRTLESLLTNAQQAHDELQSIRDNWQDGIEITGDVTINGKLTCTQHVAFQSTAKIRDIAEFSEIQVGAGGTAITMKRDQIYMGYGGVQANGDRKAGIVLELTGNNENVGNIKVRGDNGDSIKTVH